MPDTPAAPAPAPAPKPAPAKKTIGSNAMTRDPRVKPIMPAETNRVKRTAGQA